MKHGGVDCHCKSELYCLVWTVPVLKDQHLVSIEKNMHAKLFAVACRNSDMLTCSAFRHDATPVVVLQAALPLWLSAAGVAASACCSSKWRQYTVAGTFAHACGCLGAAVCCCICC
jgi:hypothetical protein